MTPKLHPPNSRIFRERAINSGGKHWIVDLSPEGIVNPDCYYRFPDKKTARAFWTLIKSDISIRDAKDRLEVNDQYPI